MLEIVNAIISWTAVLFRAGGMLVKDPMKIKILVSIGNLGWLISGALTGNIPLIASNGICLIFMAVELIKNKKNGK